MPDLTDAQVDRIFRAPAEPEPDRLVDYLERCADEILIRAVLAHNLKTDAGHGAGYAYGHVYRLLRKVLLECGRWTE